MFSLYLNIYIFIYLYIVFYFFCLSLSIYFVFQAAATVEVTEKQIIISSICRDTQNCGREQTAIYSLLLTLEHPANLEEEEEEEEEEEA